MTVTTNLEPGSAVGSVRSAEPRDDAELTDLLADSDVELSPFGLEREGGHLLVLDIDGHVRAAEFLVIDAPRACAQLQLLVVDGTLGSAARAVEDRMFGVAMAMSEAFGCAELEVSATPHQVRIKSGSSARGRR